jgi:opacity protein-like surface antigen
MGKTGWAVLLITAASIASAQDQPRFDLSVGAAGVFNKTVSSSSGNIKDSPTNSLAYIGSFRYHVTHKHAFEFSVGRTSNSQNFSVSPNVYRISTSVTQFTGAYVFSPFSTAKWQPFLLAGAGGLHFYPGNVTIDTFPTSVGTATQTSLAFLYGFGTDYHVWRVVAVRLQYRGFIFKEPDFKVPALFFTGARTHIAEPSLGIVLKF